MSVPYHKILISVALQTGALRGDQVEGLETSYISAALTKAKIDKDSRIPFSALKDAVLYAEETLATTIANTGNHPLRRFLLSQTSSITNGSLLPSTDSNGKAIIGIRGSITDAGDGKVCTAADLKVIQRIVGNAGSRYLISHYLYQIDDNRLFHTRAGVKADVCTYDAGAQRTAIDSNANILLPDSTEDAYVWGAVSCLGAGEKFASITHSQYFTDALQAIRDGMESVNPKTLVAIRA